MSRFRRVLIANRGEIALRIIRALNFLGIEPIAVYSDIDVASPHVKEASRAFHLSGAYPKDTYLNAAKILDIAKGSDCDAVHPGYGFLAESNEFSKSCRKNSIKFIGPSPDTLLTSGNKFRCKRLAESKGVPVVPYSKEPIEDARSAARLAAEIGFPVLLKSSFGGGGRGIREAKTKEDVKDAFESSEREARGSFGRFSVYIEKKLVRPRHIEVQVLANDSSTEIVHLGERECSIQRRYQKLVEVTPSPIVDQKEREIVTKYALRVAEAVHYTNAGTVEFLRDDSGKYYFLEINSRLQVEHPVTEMVTGIDIVTNQIEIASKKNARLPFKQKDVTFRGCAIECRINAEDPLAEFAPVSGKVESVRLPGGPGIRVDSALYDGMEVSHYYDSLVAKLISWGENFEQARIRAIVALNEFLLIGFDSTIPFHHEILKDEAFAAGKMDTSFIDERKIIEKMRISGAKLALSEEKYFVAGLLLSKNQFGSGRTSKVVPRPPWFGEDEIDAEGRFVDGV